MCRFAVSFAVWLLCLCQTPVLQGQQRLVVTLRSKDWIKTAAAKDDPSPSAPEAIRLLSASTEGS